LKLIPLLHVLPTIEEIKERKAAGNKVFYANKKIMFSKLLARSSKLHIYKSLVRSVVTYGCKTSVLKDIPEQQLRVSGRKERGRYTDQ
jgi:hypothetical protein